MKKNILPSLLSFKVEEWKDCINISKQFGINEFHFDVMEYEYVKNTSFNQDEFKYFLSLDKNIYANVHLMVLKPREWIDKFISNQTTCIYFHYEVMSNINDSIELIKYIKSKNIDAGIVINPNNNILEYQELLPYIDSILVMGVYPGFGGQAFIDSTILNLKDIFNFRKKKNLMFSIEFDGGLNFDTTEKIYEWTDKFVMGSFYYKNINDVDKLIKWFKKL